MAVLGRQTRVAHSADGWSGGGPSAPGDLTTRARTVCWKDVRQQARAALSALGIALGVDRTAGSLTVAEQTMVKVAREVRRGGRIRIALGVDRTAGSLTVAEHGEPRGTPGRPDPHPGRADRAEVEANTASGTISNAFEGLRVHGQWGR
ncbi:hypothetical protein ACWDE9_34015, partial [Streptomyces olivaceoviridis]